LSLLCTTKVSEWVLLNNQPENYVLVYYYRDQAGEKVQGMNKELIAGTKTANIRFMEVKNDKVTEPYYALYYRNKPFARYSDPSELSGISSSPVREKIAREIMSGKLCVMVYLKTGDQVKDQRGEAEIKNAVRSSPFKDIITYIGIDRNSGDEKHLISMLLNVEDDLKGINEPMLFGIFGRFRALEPLVAGGISAENVGLMIDFLSADCSCLIKDDLPGADIICSNNWENPHTALVNEILDADPSLLHK
jgi:hypothetical protein